MVQLDSHEKYIHTHTNNTQYANRKHLKTK